MARDLILIKLGGSLLTDKRRPGHARYEVIEGLAQQLASVRGDLAEGLVLGHGSGSFGHVAASRHGLGRGVARDPLGAAATQDAAARLHRIVTAAMLDAGVPAWSWCPSSSLRSRAGRQLAGDVEPLVRALDLGLVPVTYGDVVLDAEWGAAIASTEDLLRFLVGRLRRRGHRVRRLLWLGETAGIYDRRGRSIERVDRSNVRRVRGLIGPAAGTDVTGGMHLRLTTARQLARLGIESWIFDGRVPGQLAAALRGDAVDGTRVVG